MNPTQNDTLTKLEWELSCNESTAREILSSSLDTSIRPLWLGGRNIKGSITEDKIYIWEAFPGWRGVPIATGVVKIQPSGETSRLTAILKMSFLYRFIKPSTPKVASVVCIAVISWLLSLPGMLFENYQRLLLIFFPVGAISILLLLLFLSRSFGDEQLSDLRNFLEGAFGSYRKSAANQRSDHDRA